MECQVCAEKFTKQTRKRIECPYCQYVCCAACAQRYIIDTPDAANCMNCQRAWTRKMLTDMFTNAFVNREYRKARENILFELERAMFPDTMPHVEHEIRKSQNTQQINANLVRMSELRPANYTFHNGTMDERRAAIPARLEIYRLELENQLLSDDSLVPVKKEPAREFVKPCSWNECNGFLSTAWKCRVCSKYTCKDCHEPVVEPHVCNPDTLKSVEQLKADSKPCPKCSSLIFKIDGCDQMFCTSCHTAFSWRTGRIELGRIHNPHYYEYQRRNGQLNREIGDVQCGGMPLMHRVPADFDLHRFHRSIMEFQQYKMPSYQVGEVNIFNANLKSRVDFLMKRSSEEAFKADLYRKDKDISKKRELGMVSTTFLQIMSDLFNRYVSGNKGMEFFPELTGAIDYCNSLFADISKVYNCVVPVIKYPLIEYNKV